ncbi:hypothetical protein ATANTOWER_032208 [Ataeniobius toweri]|uniref:Uncharacterized protein n=1 Tax=Ataeniobius toweri TaxID=208326 RepID=A0ABU7C7K9_9TELE|nr:hypothetical protein [Ataeniobius toweri]
MHASNQAGTRAHTHTHTHTHAHTKIKPDHSPPPVFFTPQSNALHCFPNSASCDNRDSRDELLSHRSNSISPSLVFIYTHLRVCSERTAFKPICAFRNIVLPLKRGFGD